MTILDMGAKECTGCGDVLPLTGFTRDHRRLDGRAAECRTCTRARVADYAAGHRRSEANGSANRTGRFLCTCQPAVLKPAPSKACASCGLYVVARLHPDAQDRAIARHPWFARQQIEREAVMA